MIQEDGRVEEDRFVAQVSVLNGIRVSKVKEYVESFVVGGFVRREGDWLVWNGEGEYE